MYDMIVVGGGPAGMTAALYGLRNGKSVLVIEKAGFGGQITHSPKVENYPGTLTMSGNEFADRFLEQILAQGAEVELEQVVSVTCEGEIKVVTTEEGGRYEALTVVIATGVKHRMLGLEGEEADVMVDLAQALFGSLRENGMTAEEKKVEAVVLSDALIRLFHFDSSADLETSARALISDYLNSRILCATAKALTEKGADPFELNLDNKDKEELRIVFTAIIEEFSSEENAAEKIGYLASIMGVRLP